MAEYVIIADLLFIHIKLSKVFIWPLSTRLPLWPSFRKANTYSQRVTFLTASLSIDPFTLFVMLS